ncbi:MAG: HAD family hydrolase [Armatimonadetes bacterium]|nr:HAD family hydrolase [Armatimonadota bacterium]MBS1728893.1 HAD family hydrolase [Armatimonadota bacterium]
MDQALKDRFSQVKAVYFDLDDTLCGYWNASKAGLKSAFEQNPVPGKSPEEMVLAWGEAFRQFSPELKEQTKLYHEYLTSGTVTRTHQMQLTLLSIGVDDMELAKSLSQAYMIERDRNLHLFEDSYVIIDHLYGKYPLGLITNGPADIQNMEIDTLGIRPYFSNIFIEGEMRLGKPHRNVFELAAKAVDCTPDQLLMVGNSFGHDIKPAIDYGWATAWIRRDSDVPPSSKTGKPEAIPTEGPMPNLIISELTELLPLLEG